jgi:hypothetical protein
MTISSFSILECPCLPNPTGFCASPSECLAKRLDNLNDCEQTCKAMRELRISNSSKREKILEKIPLPSSRDLLLIAHDEWKRREERRHIHEELPWVHGWVGGFLTSRQFVKDRITKLREYDP